MLQISVGTINARSPYRVEVSGENSLSFTTDESFTYEIGFIEDYMFSVENAYQICLTPKDAPNASKDGKIQQVVTVVIEEFFQTNNVFLLYICDTRDGRQVARNRLFAKWFNQYPDCDKYTMRTIDIEYAGEHYFSSAIFRKDNPYYDEYIEAIDKFEEEMVEKLGAD